MPPKSGTVESLAPFTNEPLVDFSRQIERDRMQAALRRVQSELGRLYPAWIDGRTPTPAAAIESVNPANLRQIVGRVARCTVAQADEAVAAAVRAAPTWSRAGVWRRVEPLFETAKSLRRRRFELAAWMVLECGKQWREADADVAEAIDFCEYYARAMLELDRPRLRNQPGEDNSYFYSSRGVAVVIAPWNFPLAILCGMTMAPLAAGNPVVLKPAEQSSVVAAKFVEILRSLDLPDGVVQFVPGVGEEVGRSLAEHPDVSVVAFTGSVPVGLSLIRQAADLRPGQRTVKRVVAEMGGKNAVIVDDDADLDEAVRGVVVSAFGYQGQKCSACSRVIVLPGVYDAFVSRLRNATASLSMGPPEDPSFAVGPVIDVEARDRLLNAIQRGKQEATCLYAGDPGALSEVGCYIGPHLFSEVKPDSFLAQTELFGPILSILRARDLDEAVQIANDTSYALTGGIYSRNPEVIDRVKRDFEVGNLYINRKITGAEVDRQPFGGFKLSGVGAKAGGPDYLLQFLTPRTITENTFRRGFAPEEDV
jgi:RHH-type proline utilization regulon transcriptional repressor/proline dehydrogenase/delta 1-pyrroline-5-carboxylate dehydrogenase